MKRSQKIKWGKRIATLCVILILIGICIYLFPLIKDISTTEGQIKFKEEVDQLGMGYLIIIWSTSCSNYVSSFTRRAIRNISWYVLWNGRRNDIYFYIGIYYDNFNILSSSKIWKKTFISYI